MPAPRPAPVPKPGAGETVTLQLQMEGDGSRLPEREREALRRRAETDRAWALQRLALRNQERKEEACAAGRREAHRERDARRAAAQAADGAGRAKAERCDVDREPGPAGGCAAAGRRARAAAGDRREEVGGRARVAGGRGARLEAWPCVF